MNNRTTTRAEDRACCMLGICQIHATKLWRRLQRCETAGKKNLEAEAAVCLSQERLLGNAVLEQYGQSCKPSERVSTDLEPEILLCCPRFAIGPTAIPCGSISNEQKLSSNQSASHHSVLLKNGVFKKRWQVFLLQPPNLQSGQNPV